MKTLLLTALTLTLGLAVSGCQSTNDRGVIVSRPFVFNAPPAVPTPAPERS